MFNEIVLASNNAGKLREFKAFFEPYGVQVIPQGELNVPECPEPHCTFVENALAKARHASLVTGRPALADDSGICATALNGAPGVHSARYAGEHKNDADNNTKLGLALQDEANKEVWYVCVLVLVRSHDDPQPIILDGVWQGEWQEEARGDNGFGYDPHFYVSQYKQTAAEIPTTLKNRISHRGRAMLGLMQKMDELFHLHGLDVPEKAFFND